MRISSGGDVPRVDLETLRRLVPPLWTEWAGLEFSVEGLLRDPDSGRPLRLLQLLHGRHREPGARYAIFEDEAKPGDQLCFDLTSDDGRTVRGTLNSQWWSAELEIGDRLCAAGRADVAAALRASDVPDFLVPLIGGRAATGSVRIELSRLDRGGELVSGHARPNAEPEISRSTSSPGAMSGTDASRCTSRGVDCSVGWRFLRSGRRREAVSGTP